VPSGQQGNPQPENPTVTGRSPMYIGVGTILLIILIVLLIAFVF
jgi:hypothetical protein